MAVFVVFFFNAVAILQICVQFHFVISKYFPAEKVFYEKPNGLIHFWEQVCLKPTLDSVENSTLKCPAESIF